MSQPSMFLRKPQASEDPADEICDGGIVAGIAESASTVMLRLGSEHVETDSGPCVKPSDEALMQGIAEHRSWALDQLHARYRRLLSKIVSPILPNQADAEETIQDVFAEIWTRANRFDGSRGKPLGWIICMTRRRAIDHMRKLRSRAEAKEKFLPEEEQESEMTMHGQTSVPVCRDEVEASDLSRFLRKVIGGLPVEQGRVVHLAYFQAMSQREIARHTGLPLGTIKTRLELAKSKLLHQLGPFRAELPYTR